MSNHPFNPYWMIAITAISAPAYAQDYLNTQQAQQVLFPEAETFMPLLVKINEQQRDDIKAISGVRQRWDIQKVWKVVQKGQPIGWFVIDDVVGKHEFITYAIGLTVDGHVVGIEIMSYRETKGDQVRNADWRNQFKQKTIKDPFKLDQDIPNISGATLSCRNLTDGVKRILALQQVALNHAP
ncbi:MAG: FMN-binding protein [Methylophilus sp.]|nr:FMN-binding protein [Methylophilus sp.]